MSFINITQAIYLILLISKNTIFKRLSNKIYYILRISFLIDESFTIIEQFKSHIHIGFFRLFKVIHRYYNYDIPISKYNLSEKFKFNIISFIANLFTSSKTPYICFEVFKKVDDIFFIFYEIKGKVRIIYKNLHEFCINLCKIMLKLIDYSFYLMFFKIYFYRYDVLLEIVGNVLICIFINNIFFVLRILRNMDDIMISFYKVYINYRALNNIARGARSMRRLDFCVYMVYNSVFFSLKVMRKVCEIFIFIAKISKKLNEISIMVLKKMECIDWNVQNIKYNKKYFNLEKECKFL